MLVKRMAPLLVTAGHGALYIATDEVGGSKDELREAWASQGIKTCLRLALPSIVDGKPSSLVVNG